MIGHDQPVDLTVDDHAARQTRCLARHRSLGAGAGKEERREGGIGNHAQGFGRDLAALGVVKIGLVLKVAQGGGLAAALLDIGQGLQQLVDQLAAAEARLPALGQRRQGGRFKPALLFAQEF